MKRILLFILCSTLILPLFGGISMGGSTGYIVMPSAEIAPRAHNSSVTTAYSATLTNGQAVHIPSLTVALSDELEVNAAVDIATNVDLLINGKYQISKKGSTSFAAGLLAQVSDITNSNDLSAQIYGVSTFENNIMDFPSKTSLLLGYTFKQNLNTNINFAMGFETPIFRETFHDNVVFIMDFGNVSYSTTPSAGDADDRGLINIGLRLLPVEFLQSTYFGFDIRALDLFDSNGRAISLAASISFRP